MLNSNKTSYIIYLLKDVVINLFNLYVKLDIKLFNLQKS